jgi:hypothetical protein
MIKNALSVMPTRQIVYIVPIIVILVMSFYYGDMYAKCAGNKQFRASLNELLAVTSASGQFRLTDATDFGWDRVRVVTDFKPEASASECPFNWNWTRGERDSLISSGLITSNCVMTKLHFTVRMPVCRRRLLCSASVRITTIAVVSG